MQMALTMLLLVLATFALERQEKMEKADATAPKRMAVAVPKALPSLANCCFHHALQAVKAEQEVRAEYPANGLASMMQNLPFYTLKYDSTEHLAVVRF